MSDLNSVALIGRIANEPEFKVNGNGLTSLSFNLASNRVYVHNKETVTEVNFFRIKVWGKQADSLKEYLTKGKQVGVNGRLHQYKFSSPDGNNYNITEVVAGQIQLMNNLKNRKGTDKQDIPMDPAEDLNCEEQ